MNLQICNNYNYHSLSSSEYFSSESLPTAPSAPSTKSAQSLALGLRSWGLFVRLCVFWGI